MIMKNKNLIIGVVAMVLAVGSAAATNYFVPVATQIRAKLASGSAFTCEYIGDYCDTSGIMACQITVFVTSTGSSKNVVGRRGDCAAAPTLTHTSSTPIFTALTYYDAQ
jgi:hypothetical protein